MPAFVSKETALETWADVRGICFDMGGTLIRPDIDPTTGQVAHVLGISLEQAREVMEQRAKRRRITPEELAGELAAAFHQPASIEPLETVLSTARERAGAPELFDDTIPTLTALRQRGFALFALTNCLGSSIPDQPPALRHLLDAVIYSADSGACKPEREAFAAVENVCGLTPGQLLHIGDSARADVAGALAAGWHSAYLLRDRHDQLPQPVPCAPVLIGTLATLITLLPERPHEPEAR